MNSSTLTRIAICSLLLVVLSTPAAQPSVRHVPEQPRSGEAVRITAQFASRLNGAPILQYQIVDPGSYIALKDPAYREGWVSLAMSDSGNGTFTVALPKELQVHRRLVRYRIALGNVIEPSAESPCPNFAYFVYDGVPPWKGAINPNSDQPTLSTPTTFDTNVMRSLPVYHLISRKSSIENATWYEQTEFGDEVARKKYSYTGTFVADDGKVHDHVRFRARGGQWRHSMGKNMWKFDFPRGHHLQARDNYGREYKAKWEKLNLGACIQQASSRYRGEQGMFEAVGFRLFNMVGVEAPRTHWIQFRVIQDALENGATQYDGDFWGLYLAIEDMDDAFLKEHELPPGDLYKMDFGRPRLHTERQIDPNPNSVSEFIRGWRRSNDAWWVKTLDLPRYYSYRSILECIHHYDIYAGKNYFFFHNSESKLWSVLPWDLDLSWADNMHGNGHEPFYQAGLLRRQPFQRQYQNRLRDIRDLLYNAEQMDRLIDEYAAIISDPAGGSSFVDADRAKWDYHPIMASQWVTSKARQGEFYRISPTGDFRGMVQLMKNYVRQRSAWVDRTLLGDHDLLPAPAVRLDGNLDFSKNEIRFVASGPKNTVENFRFYWRLAEVTEGRSAGPGKYEITPIWEAKGQSSIAFPVSDRLKSGTYRLRVCIEDGEGRRSRWSDPVQFSRD